MAKDPLNLPTIVGGTPQDLLRSAAFGIADIPATDAFNPLDRVTDSQSALELAEMLYPRTHDEKQQFFENEAVAFLTAVVEFTARFAPEAHRNLGTIRDTISTLDSALNGLLKAMGR